MKKRDQYGKFIVEAKEDMFTLYNILSLLYKLAPVLIIVYALFRYFHVSEHMSNVMLELICGNSNCYCSCSTKTTSQTANGL